MFLLVISSFHSFSFPLDRSLARSLTNLLDQDAEHLGFAQIPEKFYQIPTSLGRFVNDLRPK